ncbi:hypothetical protein EXIGLDRAFT_717668 [Exidia glandulosa HHB12029]|uniref:Uncharacterized protein n=1 Tax=Exidia glandulosa HHB12029 TaxID=1314781 RepID=A0A165I7N6_EXIGL|nr:hypothetical protein EXIGLDRAFT_717668 [Exidia glandulosa HHB12029]
MHITTPTLYHTIVIRSTAQANALASALKRNPDFGRYIKKLRLEGAYGDKLKIRATASPDIPDLCMSLAIWADSGITGLTKVMSAINARRVILMTAFSTSSLNKKHTQVLDKLCQCIASWTNLETFYFSGSSVVSSPEVDKHFRLTEALTNSISLRAIHIWLDHWLSLTILDRPCRLLFEILASDDYLERLYVHGDMASEIPVYLNSRAVVLSPRICSYRRPFTSQFVLFPNG